MTLTLVIMVAILWWFFLKIPLDKAFKELDKAEKNRRKVKKRVELDKVFLSLIK